MMDPLYELYRSARRLIEKATKHCKKEEPPEELFTEWQNTIKWLDSLGKGYSESYNREKAAIESFTPEQINHICYQIGEWYLSMKPLLEGQHNLGYMKERLKIMICGDN